MNEMNASGASRPEGGAGQSLAALRAALESEPPDCIALSSPGGLWDDLRSCEAVAEGLAGLDAPAGPARDTVALAERAARGAARQIMGWDAGWRTDVLALVLDGIRRRYAFARGVLFAAHLADVVEDLAGRADSAVGGGAGGLVVGSAPSGEAAPRSGAAGDRRRLGGARASGASFRCAPIGDRYSRAALLAVLERQGVPARLGLASRAGLRDGRRACRTVARILSRMDAPVAAARETIALAGDAAKGAATQLERRDSSGGTAPERAFVLDGIRRSYDFSRGVLFAALLVPPAWRFAGVAGSSSEAGKGRR